MDHLPIRRAEIHAALGEPVRLAIVDELAASDRSPSELAARFHLPSNLLAHHLDVLESAGLIERFASAGDRRRRYLRLRHRPLADIGIAGPRRPLRPVMFVCSHNSARSQLAAALWTVRTGGEASSSGTDPAPTVHPGAVAAGRRAGLDLDGAVPRSVDLGAIDDLIVTVCDRAHEDIGAQRSSWHWSIPDPVDAGTDEAFDSTIADLDRRIDFLTA